jgi:hypothetical protein
LLLAFSGLAAAAQTTVANFDSPACSGNGIGVYQGIDFSASPWDCENARLTGQTGNSISWYQKITSGTFRFQSPSVLVAVSAATSSGSGTLTISTDAGETFSHTVTPSFQTLLTGFNKPASVVTVKFPGGWTIELDNLTYQAGSVAPTSDSLTASATLTWDDGTPVAGSIALSQITSGNTTKLLGTFPINSAGAVSGSIRIDLTQSDPLTFQIVLLSPANTQVGAVTFQVLKVMFPPSTTGINARIVVAKSTLTIKSFNIGLTP